MDQLPLGIKPLAIDLRLNSWFLVLEGDKKLTNENYITK